MHCNFIKNYNWFVIQNFLYSYKLVYILLIEDAVFKDDDQIDLKTFKILEEPITKDDDTDNKKIDAVKENHVVDTVEKKSITEEDTSMIIAEKEAPTTEPDPLPSNET